MTLQLLYFKSLKEFLRALEITKRPLQSMIASEEECDELRREGIIFVAGDAEDWILEVQNLLPEKQETKNEEEGD